MAKLLYRLGLLSARRAKTVIAAWFAILLAAGAAFMGFGGQLTDQISMPDLETTRVAERLADELPDAAGSGASVILRTDNGEEFTDEQIAQTAEVVEEIEAHSAVDSVADPFVTQTEMEDGQAEFEQGREEFESGQAEIAEGWEELEAGEAELAETREALEATPEMVEAMPGIEEELEAGEAELAAGREGLEEAEAELDDAVVEFERAERFLDLADGASVISEDGDVAIMMVTLDGAMEEISIEAMTSLGEAIAELEIDGVEILPSADLSFEMPHLFSIAEVIGLIIAAVVLLVMLGTFVGAGLPLINALVGVGIGVATAMAFSGLVDMMSMTPILGMMLGLAVGIDYALFILHRHRQQLKDGMPLLQSIALANGTAGNAVVFAGATVIIALLALNVTSIPFLGLMGTVAAFCVLVAVLLATTLTPAMLKLVGQRILRRSERAAVAEQTKLDAADEGATEADNDDAEGSTVDAPNKRRRVIDTPIRAGRAVLMGAAALLGLVVLAIPVLDMRLGLPDASSQAEDSQAYQSYIETQESFGQGMNGPLVVLADLPEDTGDTVVEDLQLDIAEELGDHRSIDTVLPITLNDDETMAAYQVVPVEGPSAESTENLVHEFRDGNPLAHTDLSDVELSVAGVTAAQIDISDVIADSMPLYLALVVGLSLLLMIMVFRSLLLPLVATVGFVFSLAGALGIVVAVFQWGWFSDLFGVTTPGPVMTFLPILMVGILFGLAMDYQLFTASGMREAYAHGAPARIAVRRGLHAGRSVVVAAALIMAAVFSGFIFTDEPMVASIGLGLAAGVILDAFVVRLVLVPSVLSLAGRGAWWLPRWLDKILPNVDVEGSALEREQSSAGPAERQQAHALIGETGERNT